jgi:hypothetical protein
MQFTFKRDFEGTERIYVGDVAIAKTNGYPEEFEWLASPPAIITAEHVYEAATKADDANFWVLSTRGGFIVDEVTVDVPVAETTSTILTLTSEDDRP